PAMAVAIVLAAWKAALPERRHVLRVVMVAVATLGVGLLAHVASLAWHGQLAEWWLFVSRLDVQQQYSASAVDAPSWLAFPQTLAQELMVAVFFLLAGSILFVAVGTGARATAPLALGIVSLL